MKPSTQIVRQQKQELLYTCSACGADRGCDCNAPAIEKLKTIQENQRAASKAYRARQKAPASYDADIESTKESGNAAVPVLEQPDLLEAAADGTEASQAKPSQAKPSQAKPSQAKPSQAKPSQAQILVDLFLLWNAASETTRKKFLERIET